MRQSTIYLIVTSCFTSIVVLFIVKQPKWPKDALETLASSGPLIFDRDSFIKEKISRDISGLITWLIVHMVMLFMYLKHGKPLEDDKAKLIQDKLIEVFQK